MKTSSKSASRLTVDQRLANFSPDDVAAALEDRSPRVRCHAIEFILDNQLKQFRQPVIARLKDKSAEVRVLAGECIAYFDEGLGWAVPDLTAQLDEKDWDVKTSAISALTLIGDPESPKQIARLLTDKDPIVRSHAAWALGEFRASDQIPALERALSQERTDRAKAGMLEALIVLGDRRKLQVLLDMLRHPDPQMRRVAANSLERIDYSAAEKAEVLAALRYAHANSLGPEETAIETVFGAISSRSR